MKNNTLKVLAVVGIIIFFYIVFYFFLSGIGTKPTDGDSIDYHIPIAYSILNGKFLNARNFIHHNPMQFLPGSSEAILAATVFLHLPINEYNVIAIIVLFFACLYTAKTFGLQGYFAVIFAVTICMLHGITRWLNSQVIDIWLLCFFLLSLSLFKKPEKSVWYFFSLGCTLGMLVGSKLTGPLFAGVLLCVYGINVLKKMRISSGFAFIIPFTFLGFFWYIRNLIGMGNPFYPQPFLFFKGNYFGILDYAVWRVLLYVPHGAARTINAIISEYTIWSLVIISIPIIYIIAVWKKNGLTAHINKLALISFFNMIFYLSLPSGPKDSLMMSSLRYSYPAFVPLILSVFILGEKYKKNEMISIIAIGNMLMLPEVSYHPKLLFIIVPFGLYAYYFQPVNQWVYSHLFPRVGLKV